MLLHLCPQCATPHQAKGRCPGCESRRNQQPNRKAHRTGHHQRVRTHVLNRDHHLCHWCGARATECDYVTPLAHGGRMHTDNAVASCKPCNSRRGARQSRT